jgi:Caspase domain
MKKNIFLTILLILLTMNLKAQVVSSGKSTIRVNNKPKVASQTVSASLSEGLAAAGTRFYAMIIGIDNYSDPNIPDLDKPISDAKMFYNVLTTKYTFEPANVRLITDATYPQIVEALDYFGKQIRPEDNFLIFFAGHGVWESQADVGFWLPSDATKSSKVAWFRNSTLRDYLREIRSKHTLLITDACFAGSILKMRDAGTDAPLAINKLYDLRSRKAMTSGTLTEVPDQSAFLKYLIDRLKSNNEKYISSEQLFSSFRIAVINNSSVVPQFGVIQDTGDEGGDFIFILRDGAAGSKDSNR